MAIDTAQRTENQRAESINRQRQQYGYERGQTMRTAAAALAPNVRSAAFNDKFTQAINNYRNPNAAPIQWSASDFQPDPGQIPNLDALAEQEVSRALAYISPSAAAKIGAPIPELPALPDVNQYLPKFTLPVAGQ